MKERERQKRLTFCLRSEIKHKGTDKCFDL